MTATVFFDPPSNPQRYAVKPSSSYTDRLFGGLESILSPEDSVYNDYVSNSHLLRNVEVEEENQDSSSADDAQAREISQRLELPSLEAEDSMRSTIDGCQQREGNHSSLDPILDGTRLDLLGGITDDGGNMVSENVEAVMQLRQTVLDAMDISPLEDGDAVDGSQEQGPSILRLFGGRRYSGRSDISKIQDLLLDAEDEKLCVTPRDSSVHVSGCERLSRQKHQVSRAQKSRAVFSQGIDDPFESKMHKYSSLDLDGQHGDSKLTTAEEAAASTASQSSIASSITSPLNSSPNSPITTASSSEDLLDGVESPASNVQSQCPSSAPTACSDESLPCRPPFPRYTDPFEAAADASSEDEDEDVEDIEVLGQTSLLKERLVYAVKGETAKKCSSRPNKQAYASEGHCACSKTIIDSTPHKVVIIIDWDDTIFPSSWMHMLQRPDLDDDSSGEVCLDILNRTRLHPDQEATMAQIETSALALLQECHIQGSLHIITNAESGWVQLSASQFMPRVFAFLAINQIPIISARACFTNMLRWRYPRPDGGDYTVEPDLWKVHTFSSLLKKIIKEEDDTRRTCLQSSAPLRSSIITSRSQSDAKLHVSGCGRRHVTRRIKFGDHRKGTLPNDWARAIRSVVGTDRSPVQEVLNGVANYCSSLISNSSMTAKQNFDEVGSSTPRKACSTSIDIGEYKDGRSPRGGRYTSSNVKLTGIKRFQFVSIGDSECERRALLTCREELYPHAYFKSIKLVEAPHPTLLIRQQELLRGSLQSILTVSDCVDLVFVEPTFMCSTDGTAPGSYVLSEGHTEARRLTTSP